MSLDGMVPRDGIEPPTRGFSILLYQLSYLGKSEESTSEGRVLNRRDLAVKN